MHISFQPVGFIVTSYAYPIKLAVIDGTSPEVNKVRKVFRTSKQLQVMFWLLLLIIGALPTSDGLKVFEFCCGKKLYIPAPVMSRVPLLACIYFTPISPGAKALMVMNRTLSLDPHYQYKDETVFISELADRDQGTFSWSCQDSTQLTDFLKLVMKDCSEHVNVYYGDKLEIFPPRRAAMLEFSPSRRPSGQRVVWRRGRTGQVNNWWSVNTTTPDHEGNYTACTHSGVELRKTRVSVIARTLQAIVEEEESFVFPLPIPASTALISFRDPSGMEHVLYQNGRERLDTFDLFKVRCWRVQRLQASDAGNWYCPPVPRSALIDDFEHIPTAPDTQVQATSQCPFTSNLSPQSDAGPCFQSKRRLGDSLDFLSTNPLSTDTLLATTYTSEKLNFL
ncbi:hypothetical protein AALO_G00193760 [Alosa alosa]|uniref:Uncharacterized protein n=1 Tax=Alosa alosa TaxID=278164 RepID=A0AAV6G7I0_9TELE|nr:hypothetical protein AALO_G00193760 [Alosa alosa]